MIDHMSNLLLHHKIWIFWIWISDAPFHHRCLWVDFHIYNVSYHRYIVSIQYNSFSLDDLSLCNL